MIALYLNDPKKLSIDFNNKCFPKRIGAQKEAGKYLNLILVPRKRLGAQKEAIKKNKAEYVN